MKSESNTPSTAIELAEVLNLKAAAPLAASFLAHRGKRSHRRCVTRSTLGGGQCLQVLLSAKYTWNADEAGFEFVNPSSEFIEALEGLGFSMEKFMDQDLPR